jgi:DNA-binding winged helix-turn-helix (wHTH) protein
VTLLPPPAATASPAESGVWHFDDFVLDGQRFVLERNGVAVRMEPQVFDVMVALVSNHHRMVTKNELLDTVWGGRFVSDAALSSRIKAARRAVGDDGTSQRYIRTVRGRGYQFVGRVAHRGRLHADAWATSASASSPDPRTVRRGSDAHADAFVRLAVVAGAGHRLSASQLSGRGPRRYRRLAPSTRRRVFHGPPR